ncbi:hypothetical protein D030_2439A, partial [Vibrio parahaemolyticus AQ3810]
MAQVVWARCIRIHP